MVLKGNDFGKSWGNGCSLLNAKRTGIETGVRGSNPQILSSRGVQLKKWGSEGERSLGNDKKT